ncbi:MAG: alpha-amylase [Verrucomicrobia bacterium]|nr:MAG: alpha-amylase [Verrucomicrobiota bacterium]
MTDPLLYEINTRCWLRELSEEKGRKLTLADIPESEFENWQRFAFTHIWLMGVWTTGPHARAQALASPELRRVFDQVLPGWAEDDVDGSPYAIADYHVSPALGGDEGLLVFRQKLNKRGLKLILDFVPNHVGIDHPWLAERPELFVQSTTNRPGTFQSDARSEIRNPKSTGPWIAYGKDPYWPGWTDTAQLDYRLPATREQMIGLLLSIGDRCDGVRCDMAMLVLNDVFTNTWKDFPGPPPPKEEFWANSISAVKKSYPDFLFLAEAYWGLESRLQSLGFDYTYDKTLYDRLVGRDAVGILQHLLGLPPQALAAGAHFLENHDEPRIASLLSAVEHPAAALLILTLPGMRFLHEGQLLGEKVRVPVQLIRRPPTPRPALAAPYEQLLTILAGTSVGRGKPTLLRPRPAWSDNPTAQNIILIQWQSKAQEFDLAVINLAAHQSQCYAPLNVSGSGEHDWTMEDLLGTEQYRRPGTELQRKGLYLDLVPHAAQLFQFRSSSPVGVKL